MIELVPQVTPSVTVPPRLVLFHWTPTHPPLLLPCLVADLCSDRASAAGACLARPRLITASSAQLVSTTSPRLLRKGNKLGGIGTAPASRARTQLMTTQNNPGLAKTSHDNLWLQRSCCGVRGCIEAPLTTGRGALPLNDAALVRTSASRKALVPARRNMAPGTHKLRLPLVRLPVSMLSMPCFPNHMRRCMSSPYLPYLKVRLQAIGISPPTTQQEAFGPWLPHHTFSVMIVQQNLLREGALWGRGHSTCNKAGASQEIMSLRISLAVCVRLF